jgi:bacteriocin-like protein
MKTDHRLKESFESFTELTNAELITIEGGGFWGQFFYLIGATAKSIWVFSKTAAEFQTSLPPSLKK